MGNVTLQPDRPHPLLVAFFEAAAAFAATAGEVRVDQEHHSGRLLL